MFLSQLPPEKIGALCAFASSFTWAVGITFYASISRRVPAYLINTYRAAVALPLFLIAAAWDPMGWGGGLASFRQITLEHFFWFFISMLSSFALGDLCFLKSAIRIGVPGALAIASSYPLLSALAGWIFNAEVLTLGRTLGLFLIIGGVILVILSGRKTAKDSASLVHQYGLGLALAFLTSVFWAMNAFSIAQVGEEVPPAAANSVRMGIALLLCPMVGVIGNAGKLPKLSTIKELFPKTPIFAFEAFFGSTFFIFGLALAPLSVAAALSSLAPAISAPIAWWMKTERFLISKLIGIISVLVGIYFLV